VFGQVLALPVVFGKVGTEVGLWKSLISLGENPLVGLGKVLRVSLVSSISPTFFFKPLTSQSRTPVFSM